MIIETTRFGKVELQPTDVLDFPDGILGFSNLTSFVLLDDPGDEIFAWLQCCESPEVAFPVLEPGLFNPNYKVKLTKSDLEALGLKPEARPMIFAIITIPEDPQQMTANLKAPIVVNVQSRRAKQCVLQNTDLAIREPIFAQLKQRVVQPLVDSTKSKAVDMGVAVRLPETPSPELTK